MTLLILFSLYKRFVILSTFTNSANIFIPDVLQVSTLFSQ